MHSITAIILKGDFNQEEAIKHDLKGVKLDFNLTMFFIDLYYTLCWQKILKIDGHLQINCSHITWYPSEMVIFELMKQITNSEQAEYAIILTDYFGGVGEQFANVYKGKENIDLKLNTINQVLECLGVAKKDKQDEFDTVGLVNYRSNPDFLGKYRDLADELGV